jgi:hypothetical protein
MTWRIEWDDGNRIGLVGPTVREASIYAGMTFPKQERMMFKAEDIVQMAKDAARYRYLRDVMDVNDWKSMTFLDRDEWDAVIDRVIAARANKEQE